MFLKIPKVFVDKERLYIL